MARIRKSPEVLEIMKYHLFIDGASRGNPGKSGSGFLILDDKGQDVDKGGSYLGVQTNNFAEYSALVEGLKACLPHGIKHLEIRSDSELLVRQVNGEYRVKSTNIAPLFRIAKSLLSQFVSVNIKHIPRSQNDKADRLANLSIDTFLEMAEKGGQPLED